MRCRKCPTRAVIKIPRHHTAFCGPCLTEFVRTQVQRAIKTERMFTPDDRILVAVSGGKDSLTLWEILLALGYRADALYVDLGIGGYSARSREKVEQFAQQFAEPRQARLLVHQIKEEEGAGIRELADLVRRPTCSACGTIKRYHFNRVALANQYDVMATGHNLDDEAARLLGNVLRWQEDYLHKQGPNLPASVEGFAKKVKPLYRLTEREIAAYALVNRIDYIVEECPMAKGSKMLLYKDVLNRLETESPGTKQTFYWRFLERQANQTSTAPSMQDTDRTVLQPCRLCGQPTTADTCMYCKMMARAKSALV
ncbi:MAG: adenine nucleotide alpha hydrolase family protein [Nitrospirae bacterium]|nr:MAG: adenine nucleotide alpha hydrolase family protein [Nitrospirota bacterium]